MSQKTILMATANYYTSPYQVGSQNYARAFQHLGYKVGYISAPLSPWHQLSKNTLDRSERRAIHHNRGCTKDDIWHYVPYSLTLPKPFPLFSSKWMFNHWYRGCIPRLLPLLKEQHLDQVDILWFDSPLYAFLMAHISHKKSILRLADHSEGFQGLSPWHLKTEHALARKTDMVVYTARALKDRYNDLNPHMHYIPNGIDLEKIQSYDRSFPKEYQQIPEQRVVYIGAIDHWFDLALIEKAAKQHPKHHFVFIGYVNVDISSLSTFNNIHFLGIQPHQKIGQFLYHAQLGIIPFKKTAFVDTIHPIKLYEYAAFNLPILTTEWEEIKSLASLCTIAKDHDAFISALRHIERLKTPSIDGLKHCSWNHRVTEILGHLYP